jgi:hypothetical protein
MEPHGSPPALDGSGQAPVRDWAAIAINLIAEIHTVGYGESLCATAIHLNRLQGAGGIAAKGIGCVCAVNGSLFTHC